MTNEAEKLMAEALKRVNLGGSFDPAALGARAGLNKLQSESAARALSNAGVLVLGFDLAAHFSPAFRKSQKPTTGKLEVSVKTRRSAKNAASKSGKKKQRVGV